MKKVTFVSLVLLIVLAATQVVAQRNYEVITVKGLDVSNGVVIVSIQEGSTQFQLQCNANVPGCYTLAGKLRDGPAPQELGNLSSTTRVNMWSPPFVVSM